MKDIFIGRTPEGGKFFLSCEVKVQSGVSSTIEHGMISDPTRLSISGVTIRKGGSIKRDGDWRSCGQNIDDLRRVRDFTDSPYRGKVSEIVAIWERWHLNDMKSHCAHQDQGIKWDEVPACSETGYKAGSRWLTEELPSSVIERLLELELISYREYAEVVADRIIRL